jgi:hypothetical protein
MKLASRRRAIPVALARLLFGHDFPFGEHVDSMVAYDRSGEKHWRTPVELFTAHIGARPARIELRSTQLAQTHETDPLATRSSVLTSHDEHWLVHEQVDPRTPIAGESGLQRPPLLTSCVVRIGSREVAADHLSQTKKAGFDSKERGLV